MAKKSRMKFRKYRIRVSKGYFKQNWGFPFIVAFLLLLIIAIIYLVSYSTELAESVANYAYYALALGVVLQIVSFLKYRKIKAP